MSITLGIDIGTSGTKTLAIDERGHDPGVGVGRVSLRPPRPGWSEQDPELWWDATVRDGRQVLASGKFEPADVAGVGLSGQMHGSVFLDAGGRGHPPRLALERPADRGRDATRSRRRPAAARR